MADQTGPDLVAEQEQALKQVVAALIQLDEPAEKVRAYRALSGQLKRVAEDLLTLARVEESLLELELGAKHRWADLRPMVRR
jgi:hypothetical protein